MLSYKLEFFLDRRSTSFPFNLNENELGALDLFAVENFRGKYKAENHSELIEKTYLNLKK